MNDNARIIARGTLANIYLLEDGSGANDHISFGANVMVQAIARTAGNGNIMVSVGNFNSAGCCTSGPSNVTVNKVGTGDVFFGSNFTNGISAVGSNTLRANNANIYFYVAPDSALGAGAITLGGGNKFIATPIVWAGADRELPEFVVDTELDSEIEYLSDGENPDRVIAP